MNERLPSAAAARSCERRFPVGAELLSGGGGVHFRVWAPGCRRVEVVCESAPGRSAAAGRSTLVVNENEPQHARLVRPLAQGGAGLDMIWNDDWHHSAMVAATGQEEAYYTDYRGRPQEFVSSAKHGFLYQGQWYRWQHQARGSQSTDLPPARFVHFLQNHDQVANSGRGERLHEQCSPARWRALTTLLLLGPQTPMLFQGQEFASSAPFLIFADHVPGPCGTEVVGIDINCGNCCVNRKFAIGHRDKRAEMAALAKTCPSHRQLGGRT